MSTDSTNASNGRQFLGAFPFVLAGLSFIPLVGVLFGLISICWGLVTRRAGGKKLALVGAGGIGFSVLLYGGLFYFGFEQRGGIYDQLRTTMAQTSLNSLIKSIEFYRVTNGEYPNSLDDLKQSLPKGSIEAAFLIDPRLTVIKGGTQYFYYKKVDANHYYLRGVGADGSPFSPGALIPQAPESGAGIGLLTAPPDQPAGSP
jgi:hypothetical protein